MGAVSGGIPELLGVPRAAQLPHAAGQVSADREDQPTNSDRVRAPAESVPAQCVFIRSRNVSRGKIMSPEPIEI